MSLANEASLLLIPSGYKSGKVYSVFPTDGDGDFTFSRGSDGTRVGAGGLVETISSNIPRLDYSNSDCPSLLLEPQRTNLVTQSEDLSTTWLKSGGVTLTSGQISPKGDTSAYKVQMTSGANNYLYIGGGTNGVEYTISGYFKADSSINIGFSDGSVSPNSIDLTTDWKRFSFTFTRNGGGLQIDNYFGVSPSQQAKTFYVWGVQMEAGSYATSYIKTTGSIITRQKDICINGGDANLFNISEGTLFVDTTPFEREATDRITLSNNNYNNRIIISKVNATQLQFFVISNNSTSLIYTPNINYNSRNKIAITFKQNEFKIYLNGLLKYTDPFGNVPTGLNDLSFKGIGNSLYWSGKIHDTRVYDRVLTQAEAIELTTL